MLFLVTITTLAAVAAEQLTVSGLTDLSWSRCAIHEDSLLSKKWEQVAKSVEERSKSKTVDRSSAECAKATDGCVALWLRNDDNTSTVLLQGCYDQNPGVCAESRCVAERQLREDVGHNGSAFWCCCRGQLCNAAEKLVVELRNETSFALPPSQASTAFSSYYWALVFVSVCLLVLIVVVVVVALLARCRFAPGIVGQKIDAEQPFLPPPPPGTESDSKEFSLTLHNAIDVQSLQLAELIGHGRYGTVYRAVRADNGESVAVKVYKDVNFCYFRNEVEVYCWPVVRDGHPHLLRFLGAAEISPRANGDTDVATTMDDVRKEYWLAVELATERTLQEYLKANAVDWERFYSLVLSVVGGLCFLHTEIRKDGEVKKPVIAHRDVSSRNVLVKADGTAVISDLGFAMPVNREELQVGQEIRLAEVGTVRYMAPEVLEGAVNLHDPAAALMQADVYACGLVLWEIFWRCENVWTENGQEPAEYLAPFAKDVPPPPSLEQMQLWVCKKQVRPLFPNPCYSPSTQTYPVLHTICNYIEDCWEKDPEGRATIACTQERFLRLQKNHKPMPGRKRIHQNLALDGGDGLTMSITDRYVMDEVNDGGPRSSSMSGWDASIPVQPYQGRNPCQERNVMPQDLSSDSSSSLPGGSGRGVTRVTRSSFRKVDPNDADSLMAHLLANKDPALKNEPKDRLMQMLLMNKSVKQPPPSNNDPPAEQGDKLSSAVL